ncbi:hypothetical protein DVH24_008057 [Malus domestica]|uniref:Uncharacterized protein n=1 Tax=Malus domestica TaxID=3750 RepID=A0A498JL35_MALDO|nr:hypothetical protein DVH24_008057 [Malus domestica]
MTPGIGMDSILDLNEAVYMEDSEVNNLALTPFLPREQDGQCMGLMNAMREMSVSELRQPIRLFGSKIEPNEVRSRRWGGEENIVLTLISGDGGELARERGDSPLSIDSNSFNLAPFIFGMGSKYGHQS